ncbi:MAG: hypothetical protein IJL17_08620 [Kiritimatiellae bacterium]|nr:hypothetical protein [Kiritimatiellia bacterium]
MKTRIIWVGVTAACLNAVAAEWLVDRTAGDDAAAAADATRATAFKTIQAAVDKASAGDVVTVLPGVYDEGGKPFTVSSVVSSNRVYITKNLTLRSRDGAVATHIVGAKDLTVALDASPWGMGPAAVRCIAVANNVTDVKIEGFTIRDGATAFGGDSAPVRGGGVLNVLAQPGVEKAGYIVVRDCVIRDNTGTRGGAIYGVTAVNCTFTGNRASTYGAAARECRLDGCVLYRNTTLGSSAVGVMAYGYTAVNCTFAYNETLSAFSNIDGASTRFASNCVAVANSGCGVDKNIYTCITDITGKPNGCLYVNESSSRIFVAPAAGDFRLRAEGEAVTKNPLADGYCGAVQEAVSCAGSGRITFSAAADGTMSVDGVPVRSSTYAYAAPWPRAYAVTFAPNEGKGLVCYQYGNLSRWPTADEVYYVLPPVSGSASVVPVVGNVRYVSPAGDDAADGSAATPWRTLQGAMDGLERDSVGNAVVYAHPGRYDEGGAVLRGVSNRVVFSTTTSVRLKALEGPQNTFIVGAEDPAPVVANDYGLGPNATRCVAFPKASHSVQGFTLTGGRTSVNADNSDSLGVRGGAAVALGEQSNQTHNSALLDCVVSNCVASRAASMFGGSEERCLLVDNVSVAGGNAITRTGNLRSSIVTRNRSANAIVGQNTDARNCTVVSNYCVNAQLATTANVASNVVFAANAAATDIESSKGVGYCVYEKSSFSPPSSVKEATLFADYLNGDFRPYAGSAGTYFGLANAFSEGSCFADFNGKPFPIGPNGRITAGAVSDLVPSVRVVSPVPGGTDVEGVVAEFPVTVTATRADRQLLGFEVNGATQAVSGASVTVTADDVAGFSSYVVKPVYNTDWWVDAVNGDDANTGWTAASAKKTLAGAMSHAWAGDTVHALPGVYDAGTMVQDNPILTTATRNKSDVVIPSRVVMQTNVTLVAEGALDETVIQGTLDPETAGGYGLGLGGVRCVYLNDGAKVKGFTIRGGRTDGTNEMDDNNYGGGVLGRSIAGVTVEECVLTNCVATRGGAGYKVTFRRCRILDNHATGNSPVGREVALYGCYAAGNLAPGGGVYSGLVQYHTDVVGCTFAADNGLGTMTERTGDCRLSVGQYKGYKFWNNVVAMPNSDSNKHVISNAYGNVFSTALNLDVVQGEGNVYASLDEIALGPDGVPRHGSAAIDASNFEYALTNLTGETGLNGVRRGLGGGVDAGAFEFDWLPRFAQDLGPKNLVVTEVDNAVFENGDGLVEIPSGSLALTWTPAPRQNMNCPCSFQVNVTGTGTLTVMKDGEAFGTYAQGVHDVTFSGSGAMAFTFSYEPGANDEGGAVLSNFFASIGMTIFIR